MIENEKKSLLECRRWLNFFDPSPEYERHRKAQKEGTGQWILEDCEFKKWLQLREGVLWIKGRAGAGKSVLTSFIIDHLKQQDSPKKVRCIHIYFFFRNGDDRTAGSVTMLASLVEQLFRSTDKANQRCLFDIIKPSYDKNGSSTCSEGELWKILSTMLASLSIPVVIFPDALDECIDPSSVITRLKNFKARILVTSRPEPNIFRAFEQHPPENSVAMNVQHDIEMFIDSEVDKNTRLKPHRDAIVSKVKQTANGMFRYAGLILEELQRPSGPKKVAEILQSLPNGLNEMYTLMLKRLPPHLEPLRKTTSTFISGAFRPVTIAEIAYADAVKPGEDFDPNEVLIATKEEIIEACGSMVEVFESYISDIQKEPIEMLRFSHLTVKEFLLNDPSAMYTVDIRSGIDGKADHLLRSSIGLHASIASVCTISLLSKNALLEAKTHTLSPLLYCSTYVLRHASIVMQEDALSETLQAGLQQLLSNHEPYFQLWKDSLPLYSSDIDVNFDTPIYFSSEYERQLLEIVHIIAYYGFFSLMHDSLISGYNINVFDYNGRTPLYWAASKGHKRVVQLLLAQDGVDINKANNNRETPLCRAAYSGREKVVNILLAQDGVDVHKANDFVETSLWVAACNGHEKMVELLLAQDGVGVNKANNFGETPLWAAVWSGHEKVVGLLLAEDGVEVNKANFNSQMPLLGATASGREKVVDLLLAKDGVDMSKPNDEGQKSLYSAIYSSA